MSLKSLFFWSSLFGEGSLNENVSVERKLSALRDAYLDQGNILTLRPEGFNFGGVSLNFSSLTKPGSTAIEVFRDERFANALFQYTLIDAAITYGEPINVGLAGSVSAGNVAGGNYSCTISAQLEGVVAMAHIVREESLTETRIVDSASVTYNRGIFRSPSAACTGNSGSQLVSEALETSLDGESITSSSLSTLGEKIGMSLAIGAVREVESNLFSNLPDTRLSNHLFRGDTDCCGLVRGSLTFTSVTSHGSPNVEIAQIQGADTSLLRDTVIDSLVSYNEPLQVELAGDVTGEFGDVPCTISARLENAVGSAYVLRQQPKSEGFANNELLFLDFFGGTFSSPSAKCTGDNAEDLARDVELLFHF